jgi:hypothetical protein
MTTTRHPARSAHVQRVRKGNRVKDVVRLGLRALGVHVRQYDFAADAAHNHRIGGGRPDRAASDNADFHAALLFTGFRSDAGRDYSTGIREEAAGKLEASAELRRRLPKPMGW